MLYHSAMVLHPSVKLIGSDSHTLPSIKLVDYVAILLIHHSFDFVTLPLDLSGIENILVLSTC